MIFSTRMMGVLFTITGLVGPTAAGVVATVSTQAIELAVEQAAKVSGRKVAGTAAKAAATAEVKRLAVKHGEGVLKVVEDSGLELIEAIPKHGDELVQIAMKASPQARRALALNVDQMLPLTKRVGLDALELEAKVPGMSTHAFQVFGDDAGKVLAKSIPTQDIPRLVTYAEKADSETTRKLLLDKYAKEGPSLFQRVPPQVILAGGLSASMLLGTYEVSAPSRAKAEVLRNNPEIVRDVMNRSTTVWAGIALVVIVFLLWRFGLMPWHGRRSKSNLLNKP